MTIAKAERLPSVALNSSLGRVGYPSDGFLPGAGDFRTNWSLGATVNVAVFTGHRLRANELAARADLAEAQARLKQTRELAELDAATALQDLAAAEAVWEASAGTIQQAERAYQIAELRNREGLSTQLELSRTRACRYRWRRPIARRPRATSRWHARASLTRTVSGGSGLELRK